jgi:tetratricopeptide (TPR) repeat protein
VGLLAVNRSFAVWSTSGLETRFFEFLVVAAVLLTLDTIESGKKTTLLPALLFGLACLTRPDGVLIAASVLGVQLALQLRRKANVRTTLQTAMAVAVIVAAHVTFRLLYYGDWVPNTYHAKVGGTTWWSMGARYVAALALEYGVFFWLPLLILVLIAARRDAMLQTRIVLFGAALVPIVAWVVAIGGDHFEYRPLDMLFPFAYLLLAEGVALLWHRRPRDRAMAASALLAVAVGTACLPMLSHVSMPRDYRPGFPGASARVDGTRELISRRDYGVLFSVPILKHTLDVYNDLVRSLTLHGVGIRQEEHALFLAVAVEQGLGLARAVDSGLLPRNAHIATGAVGAIPYYSGLRTLDLLGLTDRVVAKGPRRPTALRALAHDRVASMEYARSQGVDLWAPDGTNFLYPIATIRIPHFAKKAQTYNAPLAIAAIDSGLALMGYAPQGLAFATYRVKGLVDALAFYQSRAEGSDMTWWALANVGSLSAVRGETEAALHAYHRALALNLPLPTVEHWLGKLLLDCRLLDDAAVHLERSIALDPHQPEALVDLSLALDLLHRDDQAAVLLHRAVQLDPVSVPIGVAFAKFLLSASDPAYRDPVRALEMAEYLLWLTRGRDAEVMEVLATSYGAIGDYGRAQETAKAALAIAESRGEDQLMGLIRQRVAAYEKGRMWF